MRRRFLPGLLAAVLLFLPACSGTAANASISPDLTESTQDVLEAFGMAGTASLLSFQGPEEAITLRLRVHHLGEDGAWEEADTWGTSIGEERTPVDRLSGTLAIQLQEDGSLGFHIRSGGGLASCQTEPIGLEPAASARCFLTESRDLPLNQEVPVALLLYGVDGDGIPVCSLEDFADPSRLAGLELVQAVTVECTDQAL